MLKSQGMKIMIDLHGLSIKEVKKLLEEHFKKMEQDNIGEFYLITGRGNHVNANGARGVLRKALPKLLKPYCQSIIQTNKETGAYKIILKPKQALSGLKTILSNLLGNEETQTHYATMLTQQAKENNIEAILALATIHLHQLIKGFDNKQKGLALLLQAKKLGSLDADILLGVLYQDGTIVKQQHEKAFKFFENAANQKHPVAQYYMAACYLHGKGVKYNDELAVSWMKKSAEQGDVHAEDSLGDFYLMGKITQQDMEAGIYYKTKAAEKGLVEAQIDLGRCYATGYGVKQDYEIAFQWYLRAAESNSPYALYQVGTYLFDGRCGFAAKTNDAFDWFLKAAELGDADGQAQVAWFYLFGEDDFQQDIKKGLAWATKAVAQKNKHGYYVMAKAYLEGVGVPQDVSKGQHFMQLSAEEDYADAEQEFGLTREEKQSYATKTEKAASVPPSEIKSETTLSSILEFSLSNYYSLGELTQHLLIVTWFLTEPQSRNSLKKAHKLLHDEFIRRVDALKVPRPEKKAKETLLEYLFNYAENVEKHIGKNPLIFFNIGFKIMAVKMIQFTGHQAEIIEELIDCLRAVKTDTALVDKMEQQLLTTKTTDLEKTVTQLEVELKQYLIDSHLVKVQEQMEKEGKEPRDEPVRITPVTTPPVETPPVNVNRYSMWHNRVGIALTATVAAAAAAAAIGALKL